MSETRSKAAVIQKAYRDRHRERWDREKSESKETRLRQSIALMDEGVSMFDALKSVGLRLIDGFYQ